MPNSSLKKIWLKNYRSNSDQLMKLSEVNGLISAFNANIDAVINLTGQKIEELINDHVEKETVLFKGKNLISTEEDLFRGLFHCFSKGIAEEWLINNLNVYNRIKNTLAFNKLQMGGQGGIVANVMTVCGVNPVYVHCASLPEQQAELFSDLPNLYSVDENSEIKSANKIRRNKDIPLIHYILEFNRGDTINIFGKKYTCPKSNRFIATYDPLNFKLHIDERFIERLSKPDINFDYIILSGFQMLQEKIKDRIIGKDRVDNSMEMVEKLKYNNSDSIIHFEVASTQDKVIRKYLIDTIAKQVDSLGFNERELIDILEVINEIELAQECNNKTNSVNLFKGMLKVYEYTECPRLQLHMFGIYITLQKKGFKISPEQNKNGMQLAASVAAAKAGTGFLNSKENLTWAFGKEVSDIGLNELFQLQKYIKEKFSDNHILETGIFSNDSIDIIAIPSILIENPITLVGMGDTISSISLVSAL